LVYLLVIFIWRVVYLDVSWDYHGGNIAKLGAVGIAPDRIDLFGAAVFNPTNQSIYSWVSKNEQSVWCTQTDIMEPPWQGYPDIKANKGRYGSSN